MFRSARTVISALLILAMPALAHAAEKSPMKFDLPATSAEAALKLLSTQSGVGVIFTTEMTENVRTRSVRGTFTPLEAANRMLAGTNLVALQDERTGTLTINHAEKNQAQKKVAGRSPANNPQAEGPAGRTAPVTPTGRAIPSRAEVGRAAEVEEQDEVEEQEAHVLSPFVVSSERDAGYQARTTLAGNRLASDVRDIGAAISIYTKEFMNDIGATNATDILVFAPGMDAAGPQGNYSGATGDINAVMVTTEVRQQPQASRTRGLASPNFTRGYFPTSIPLDSYNTGTVTVNRGPNAILFGAGSPAGVVDTTLLISDVASNRSSVQLRYGDNDSVRAVLDVNRVLIPDKLGVRLIGLEDRERFDQRPAFEDKQRIFGAITGKPFSKTTLRAHFETGHTRNSRPQTVLPFDNVTPWLEHGGPIWDPSFYDDPSRHPSAASVNSGAAGATNSVTLNPGFGLRSMLNQIQLFDQVAIIYSQPDALQPDNSFRATVPSVNRGSTAPNALRNNLFHPLVNRDNPNTTPGAGNNTGDFWAFVASRNIREMPLSFFQALDPGATFVPPGIKQQGFTDYRYFDFRHRMLDTTYSQTDSFQTFDIALEQLAWGDRLGVEAVYNWQRYDSDTRNLFLGTANSNRIPIDTTVTLPTGQPNPNVGRPYIQSRSNFRKTSEIAENIRLTAFARYNFNDLSRELGKWLGRHTLTGLYQVNAAENLGYNYRLVPVGDASEAIGGPIAGSPRMPIFITYIGDSVLNGAPLRFQQVTIPQPGAGLTVDTTYFAAPAGSAAQGDFVQAQQTIREVLTTGAASREVIKSEALALQSHWLQDHLVTTFGWRRDRDYLALQNMNDAMTENPLPPGTFFARQPALHQAHYGLNDFDFPSTPEFQVGSTTRSWSAVLRWPQRIVRLPGGVDASIFYNDSQNFTPTGNRVTPFNEPISPPIGKTKEYGLNLSFLNDRFMLRLNRYETAVQGQGINNMVQRNLFILGVNARFAAWSEEANIARLVDDPRFAAASAADVETLLAPLPANWREMYELTVTGEAPNIQSSFRAGQLPGATDTTDFSAEGTEVEFTFNPNRQWRILANVSRQETIQTNIAPGTIALVERMRPAFDALAGRPLDNYPVTNADGTPYVFGTPLPASVTTYGEWLETNVDVPLATLLATEGSASAELPEWRANFVGNYTFASDSRLRGWNIGTGIRWQGKYALGYPVSRAAADETVTIDVENPYWASEQLNVDGWIGYQRRIWNDRILWKVQLNVRNLAGDEDTIPITSQPWGAPAIVRIPPEKRWYLTSTFMF